MLTGSWQQSDALQLWKFNSGELVQNIPFPCSGEGGQFLYAARFCDNDTIIAGGSGTNTALAIHFPTGQVLFTTNLSIAIL